jgi:hypothetical protein
MRDDPLAGPAVELAFRVAFGQASSSCARSAMTCGLALVGSPRPANGLGLSSAIISASS